MSMAMAAVAIERHERRCWSARRGASSSAEEPIVGFPVVARVCSARHGRGSGDSRRGSQRPWPGVVRRAGIQWSGEGGGGDPAACAAAVGASGSGGVSQGRSACE